MHHIAVRASNFDETETVAIEDRRGNELTPSCKFGDIKLAYLAIDQDLGVLIEIFSGLPNTDKARLR